MSWTKIVVVFLLVQFGAAERLLAQSPREVGGGELSGDPYWLREFGELDCIDFQEFNCGWVVTGDNTSSPNNVETYGCNNWNESGGEQIWLLALNESQEVSIVLETPPACDLDLFLLSACDADSCIDANNVVINRSLVAGEYYIVVDGFEGAACEYQLSLTCEDVVTDARSSEVVFRLMTAAPNPFNPQTTISYTISVVDHVRVQVVDLRGRRIATLVDEVVATGRHEVIWNGRDNAGHDVPSGIYFSRLEANGQVAHGRMTLVR